MMPRKSHPGQSEGKKTFHDCMLRISLKKRKKHVFSYQEQQLLDKKIKIVLYSSLVSLICYI